MPSFEGNLLNQRHQITSSETRDPRPPYGENAESLSDLGLIRYRAVTPQTDGIPIANTRCVRTAVARNKNDNKMCLETPHNVPFIRPINQQQ